tara:strand:+ start:271 stop:435 length:165 start_codon:yes stop_codon:yes gene_type:complete
MMIMQIKKKPVKDIPIAIIYFMVPCGAITFPNPAIRKIMHIKILESKEIWMKRL